MTRNQLLTDLFVEGTPEWRVAQDAAHAAMNDRIGVIIETPDLVEVLYALDHARDVAIAALDAVEPSA